MDFERVIYHQNNAPSHTAADTILDIELLSSKILKHPAYLPDLASMDFMAFPELRQELRGLKFDSVEDLVKNTQRIVFSFSDDWYRSIFDKWVFRHKKCKIEWRISMGECSTILSAYTKYRHLG